MVKYLCLLLSLLACEEVVGSILTHAVQISFSHFHGCILPPSVRMYRLIRARCIRYPQFETGSDVSVSQSQTGMDVLRELKSLALNPELLGLNVIQVLARAGNNMSCTLC